MPFYCSQRALNMLSSKKILTTLIKAIFPEEISPVASKDKLKGFIRSPKFQQELQWEQCIISSHHVIDLRVSNKFLVIIGCRNPADNCLRGWMNVLVNLCQLKRAGTRLRNISTSNSGSRSIFDAILKNLTLMPQC
jgi:hypothetical protein